MKKTYIAPAAKALSLHPEQMLATSGDEQNITIDKNGSLDNSSDMRSRRTIWNGGMPAKKGWLE